MTHTVTYKDKKFKVFQSENGCFFNPSSPIVFMPEITTAEIKAAKKASLYFAYETYCLTHKKITFESWLKSKHSLQIRQQMNFIYDSYSKYKSPFYTPEFRELIQTAINNNVSALVIEEFVKFLIKLRSISEEATLDVFFAFYENATALHQFRQENLDFDFSEFEIKCDWQKQFMNKTYHLSRETGRGEFGSLFVFKNDFRWPCHLGGDVDYYVDDDWVSVEWKSCKTRLQNIRLGSVSSWPDSMTYKTLIADESLKYSSLIKEVNPRTLHENISGVTRVFGTIELFVESMRADICAAIFNRKLFVYVIDESKIINVKKDSVYPYGVTSEGRFLFTIVPNKRLIIK